LKPVGSVIDRVILTSVESVWNVHEHASPTSSEKEMTAYLIEYRSPLAAASFPRLVNQSSALQAASPAAETARLFSLLGIGVNALKGFAALVMLCAGLGIFVGLMNALDDRRRDLVLLRVLGASPTTVWLTVALQGFALGLLGVILGWLLGHLGAEWIGVSMANNHGFKLSGWTLIREECWVLGAALLVSVLVASVARLSRGGAGNFGSRLMVSSAPWLNQVNS
jgi:putative ABC transport system permease protein